MAPKKSQTAKASLKKAGTMVATIAAGEEFLQRKPNAAPTSSEATSKPKLTKTRTMQNTTKEAKALLGSEVLADTRAETKRRQAAKPKVVRKPALKRLGTMGKTAREGKAYIKRTNASKSKPKTTTRRKPVGGQGKKSSK